jgi:transposase
MNATYRPRRKRLSCESRCEIVWKVIEAGMSPEQAAACSSVHRSTAYRLLERHRKGGWAALAARPSTPLRQPRRLSDEAEREIVALRAHRVRPAQAGGDPRPARLDGRQDAPPARLLPLAPA